MDRRIIEKDGKWRNDHGIDAEWTIFDGKSFFVDTCYDTYLKRKKDQMFMKFSRAISRRFSFRHLVISSLIFEYR